MLDGWCKGRNAHSLGSQVWDQQRIRVDEERMWPVGDLLWLRSVLWVFFSALTLLVGWQEHHLAHKKPKPFTSKDFPREQVHEGNWGGTGYPRSRPLSRRWWIFYACYITHFWLKSERTEVTAHRHESDDICMADVCSLICVCKLLIWPRSPFNVACRKLSGLQSENTHTHILLSCTVEQNFGQYSQ